MAGDDEVGEDVAACCHCAVAADGGEIYREPFAHSPGLSAIGAALSKCQGAVKNAAKDRLNPHFKATYADLASVWEECRGALAANGLDVNQSALSDDGKRVTVVTLLIHSSGEWIRSELTMVPTQPGPQGMVSATTYARRTALAATVGVAPGDDDDGEAATDHGHNGRPPPRQTVAQQAPPDDGIPSPADLLRDSLKDRRQKLHDKAASRVDVAAWVEDVKKDYEAKGLTEAHFTELRNFHKSFAANGEART